MSHSLSCQPLLYVSLYSINLAIMILCVYVSLCMHVCVSLNCCPPVVVITGRKMVTHSLLAFSFYAVLNKIRRGSPIH